ncbi:MAG: Transcriptional regulator, AcrR family [Ktedonobacterales bacterium]|jgi:AcrR family transcriptional regulator|nr:MAG: Transcriptional regulator, AcrR family [Ktedonobacterales bacterium]
MRTQTVARKRGRERDSDAARTAILSAAREEFAAHGFSGARIDDIARAAGYNKALIFHYFGDKLGLYRTLMSHTKERMFGRFNALYEDVFRQEDDMVSADRVRYFTAECVRAVFDYYAAHPQIARIFAWEAAEGWRTYISCSPHAPSSWATRVLDLAQRWQAAGIARKDLDPVLLHTTLTSLPMFHLVSLPRYQTIYPDTDFTSPEALAHAREQLTELVLRGILTQPEEA